MIEAEENATMQKIAVIDEFSHRNFVGPTMLRLGPEWVTYYCRSQVFLKAPKSYFGRILFKLFYGCITRSHRHVRSRFLKNILKVFFYFTPDSHNERQSKFAGKLCKIVCYCIIKNADDISWAKFFAQLIYADIEIVFDNYEKALSHPAILMDVWYPQWWPNPNSLLTTILQSGTQIVCYTHGTDSMPTPQANQFMLYSSDMQFFKGVGNGRYMLNKCGKPVWGESTAGGEGAVAGLMHFGEWLTRRKTPKATLKAELAKTMRVEFDPALPLLVYYTSERCNGRQMDEGLMRLSEHANIVIKSAYIYTTSAQGKNIHIYTDNTVGTFLPRFAADYVLAGYCSGTLTTSIMLGLRTIPVFTPEADTLGFAGWEAPGCKAYEDWACSGKPRFAHYADYIKGLYAAILQYITPLNIMETEMLMRRIHDAAYWKTYDNSIWRIRRNIFGACPLDGHIHAAEHIKNVLRYGTLLRKDIADCNRAWQGTPEISKS